MLKLSRIALRFYGLRVREFLVSINNVGFSTEAESGDDTFGFEHDDDEIELLYSKRNRRIEDNAPKEEKRHSSPFVRSSTTEFSTPKQNERLIPRQALKDDDERSESSLPVTIISRQDSRQDAPRSQPSQEPYEGGFVSVDESPYRLREMFQVKELWRESLMHPGKKFENLMNHMKPLALWQNLHAYLIGGKALNEVQSSRRHKIRYEKEIREIRDAVVSGEFTWRGQSGIFIQGEMRRGMEPRMYRSDVKEMQELLSTKERYPNSNRIDMDLKSSLEAFFQDRLVMEVMRVVLEPVYETTFSDASHAFRPGRTQHTALKQVRRDFSDSMWLFRSDLRGLFELVLENRRKFTSNLKRILQRRIEDETFLELLYTGLNSKTIMSDYEINPPEEGYSPLSAKSGIVPLLCNIYFDALDQWIIKKSKEINRGRFRRINPERAALMLRGLETKIPTELLPLDPNDPVYRKLSYCRFADDFLFGFSGPREFAIELQTEFWQFANEHLQFPLPTANINHVRFKTRFLGHTLRRRVIIPRKALLEVKRTNKGRIVNEKDADEVQVGSQWYQVPKEKPDPELEAVNGALESNSGLVLSDGPKEILSIDGETDKIVRLLARAGYCHKNGDPQPNFKHLHFAQSETNQIVRRMLLSTCDFYRTARNRQRLVHYCSYILRHSVAKMYAAKFKLRSRAKVFKRGGAHLGMKIKYGKGYIGKIDPDTGRGIEEFAELPYARLAEVPKPDLVPMPPDWKPEIMHILHERLLEHVPQF
eukprot:g4088.t1